MSTKKAVEKEAINILLETIYEFVDLKQIIDGFSPISKRGIQFKLDAIEEIAEIHNLLENLPLVQKEVQKTDNVVPLKKGAKKPDSQEGREEADDGIPQFIKDIIANAPDGAEIEVIELDIDEDGYADTPFGKVKVK